MPLTCVPHNLVLLQPFRSLGFLSCQMETVSSPLAARGPGITCDAPRDMIGTCSIKVPNSLSVPAYNTRSLSVKWTSRQTNGRAGPSERCVLDLPVQNVLLSTYFVLSCGLNLETEKTRSLSPWSSGLLLVTTVGDIK